MLRGRDRGAQRSRGDDVERHQHGADRDVELCGGRDGDRDHDERGRRVADQLPEGSGRHGHADQQRVRPGVADGRHEPVGELLRRPADRHRRRQGTTTAASTTKTIVLSAKATA
jgi:hypothetical protein